MPTPDLDIATKLQTEGVGTVGTDIFRGGQRPPSNVIPHAAIFVIPTGGTGPLPFLDNASTNYYIPTVQLIVRGNVGTYITTLGTATSCITNLHQSTISGYFSILVRNPEPLYLGLDENDHPLFSVNVELQYTG